MTSRELILSICDLPAVPAVAARILRLVDAPDSSIDEIHKAIMADQALTARVLKTANSAFYSLGHNISTISEAANIMGLNTIKNIVLAVSTRELYKRFGLMEQKLWEHSLGVSIAAGLLANETYFLKKEEAVLAGLMHDVGKVIMNNSQHERFLILTQRVYEEHVTYAAIESEVFGFTHAEAGFLLAEKWGFPQMLCETIRNHHLAVNKEEDSLKADPYLSAMCSTVALADALCVRLGVGYRGPRADLDLGDEGLRKQLKITTERYEELTELFKNTYIGEKLSFQE